MSKIKFLNGRQIRASVNSGYNHELDLKEGNIVDIKVYPNKSNLLVEIEFETVPESLWSYRYFKNSDENILQVNPYNIDKLSNK